MNTRTILSAAAIAATLSLNTAPANAQDESNRQRNRQERQAMRDHRLGRVIQSDALLGRQVVGQNGNQFGAIDDAILDLESGRILFVVVDLRGEGENNRVAVPASLLTMNAPAAREAERRRNRDNDDRPGLRLGNRDRDEEDRPGRRIGQQVADRRPFGIHVGREALTGAPQFDRDQAESMASAAFVDKVYRHFNQPTWWAGEQGSAAGEFRHVRRLSKMSNFSVQDVSSANLGKVESVLLDVPAGRVLFVMLDPAKRISERRELIPIPPMALTKGGEKGMLTLNADREKLNGAPNVDRAELTREEVRQLGDPQFAKRVYDYFGKKAWFEAEGTLSPTGFDEPRRNRENNN